MRETINLIKKWDKETIDRVNNDMENDKFLLNV